MAGAYLGCQRGGVGGCGFDVQMADGGGWVDGLIACLILYSFLVGYLFFCRMGAAIGVARRP
jgi:hypothetical protein